MPAVILVRDDPECPLFAAPDALFSRIRRAAEWCFQTEYQFVKSAIEDKLDEITPWMEADELKEEE